MEIILHKLDENIYKGDILAGNQESGFQGGFFFDRKDGDFCEIVFEHGVAGQNNIMNEADANIIGHGGEPGANAGGGKADAGLLAAGKKVGLDIADIAGFVGEAHERIVLDGFEGYLPAAGKVGLLTDAADVFTGEQREKAPVVAMLVAVLHFRGGLGDGNQAHFGLPVGLGIFDEVFENVAGNFF